MPLPLQRPTAPPIPALDPGKLGRTLPTHTHPGFGYPLTAGALGVWSTFGAGEPRGRVAAGSVLCFYVDDERFNDLARDPQGKTAEIKRQGWESVVEPDFSVWADDPLPAQQAAIVRTRTLGRLFQGAGLKVIPSLNWSTAESYSFAFQGIPKNPPMAACECQTAAHPESRARFKAGLAAAVHVVAPQRMFIYGGEEHEDWVRPILPYGPKYYFLPTWHNARRAMEES